MAGNDNFQWSSDGRYRYHPEAGYDGHRVDRINDDGGSIDATTHNASENLQSSMQGWPYSSQSNHSNDDNHLAAAAAAAAYRQPSQEPFAYRAFDARPSYRNISQHSELRQGMFPGDITRQAPHPGYTYSQPMAALPNLMRTPCANRYEDRVRSLGEPSWPRFDPRTAHGGIQLESPLEVEQRNRQVSERIDQDHGYTEAQPNVHFNPQPQFVMTPSPAGYAMTRTNRTTLSSSAPWSPENTRQDDPQDSLDFQTSELVQKIGSSRTYSDMTGYDTTESTGTDDLNTSATSLSLDVDLMESVETLRPEGHRFGNRTLGDDNSHALPAQDFLGDALSWPWGDGFKCNVRPSTPPFGNDVDPSLQFAEDPGCLPVPQSYTSTSEASSPVSTASPSVSDVLQCTICFTEFNGKYRQGNLSRHMRHKHKGKVVIECEDDNCSKTFERKDARLKHYRRHHPYLAQGPIVRRGSQSLRQRSRSRTPIGGYEPQELVLSNMSGWALHPHQGRHG